MTYKLKRRAMVFGAGAALGISTLMASTALAAEPIKFGVVAHLTGPLAGGEAVTHTPNIEFWANQVNARGGLKVEPR